MNNEIKFLNDEIEKLKEENSDLIDRINELEAEAEAMYDDYEHKLNEAYLELEQSFNYKDLIYHMELDGVLTNEIRAYFEHYFHWYANRVEANEIL